MSFWEHLEVLRWHIVRSAFAVVAFAILAYIYSDFIFDKIILAPKNPGFITNRFLCKIGEMINVDYFCISNLVFKIINTDMSGQLMMDIYVSMIAGVILAIPYVLWEIWRFIKPALKENERKKSRSFVFVTSILFFIGVVFSYFLIVPLTINFLGTYKVSENIENYITLNSYISTVTNLSFATGLVFEFPVLVYFLTKAGILKPSFLTKYRRHIIVVILIVGAIITPPDIFSQIMVSIPMYGLFEMSIYISKIVYKKRIRKQNMAG
ncbi:MAG: twin-arginine translocase subunit TatC [Bacteroidetes bacterium]|nr:twin-arginine translocase subunit TatC [Bacteroidota bacterium]